MCEAQRVVQTLVRETCVHSYLEARHLGVLVVRRRRRAVATRPHTTRMDGRILRRFAERPHVGTGGHGPAVGCRLRDERVPRRAGVCVRADRGRLQPASGPSDGHPHDDAPAVEHARGIVGGLKYVSRDL